MPSSYWEAELEAAEAFHNQSNEVSLEDELELLPPAAEQTSIVLLRPGFEQEITEVGDRGKHHWRVS